MLFKKYIFVANFLKDVSIVHQKTNAYTPEQTGLKIFERARYFVIWCRIRKFWAGAKNIAVHLRNSSGLRSGAICRAVTTKGPNCRDAISPMECKLIIQKSETCDDEIPYQQ